MRANVEVIRMSTQTTTYREIDILHGCDIVTAIFQAHFVLPADKGKPLGFQRFVLPPGQSAPPQSGKVHLKDSTEQQLLSRAEAMIDSYLDDER